MGKFTKEFGQLLHSMNRAQERYGIFIGQNGMKKIVSMIQNKQSRFIEKRTNRVSIHEVSYHDGVTGKDVDLIVVYDKTRGSVCSLLLPEHLAQYEKETSHDEQQGA